MALSPFGRVLSRLNLLSLNNDVFIRSGSLVSADGFSKITADELNSWSAPSLEPYILWAILTALLFVFGLLMLKRRKVEICGFSGRSKTLNFLLTAMLSVSAGSTIVAVNFYFSQITDKQYLITGIITVLLSAVIFVVFDIMLNRSFKALKKDWKYGLVHVALAVAVMLSLYTGFFGYSSRVPDVGSIESASVSAPDILLGSYRTRADELKFNANSGYYLAFDENGNPVKGADGAIKIDRGPTIRTFVNDFVSRNLDNYLYKHKDIVPIIEEKIKDSKKEREDIAGIQKKTREKNKKANVYNKKLRDCRFHYCDKPVKGKEDEGEKSSIFITEGDSASGTITKVRNANNQAVFSLRGKPINSYKESHRKVAENEELNLLISALGVEEDLKNLRYNNIIVATDADDDGMHIRMLVLTFFMKYYPDLIRRNHVYILQTPLFRVRNKKETRYCYNDDEKAQAIKDLKTGVEITRFKGLGEISPNEFVDFIGENMRLDAVNLAKDESIASIMEFYMGDNTIDRQNFIRKNLRSETELEDINI